MSPELVLACEAVGAEVRHLGNPVLKLHKLKSRVKILVQRGPNYL